MQASEHGGAAAQAALDGTVDRALSPGHGAVDLAARMGNYNPVASGACAVRSGDSVVRSAGARPANESG
jgi:hypothetical protein